jgi:hypothetical protein
MPSSTPMAGCGWLWPSLLLLAVAGWGWLAVTGSGFPRLSTFPVLLSSFPCDCFSPLWPGADGCGCGRSVRIPFFLSFSFPPPWFFPGPKRTVRKSKLPPPVSAAAGVFFPAQQTLFQPASQPDSWLAQPANQSLRPHFSFVSFLVRLVSHSAPRRPMTNEHSVRRFMLT